MPAMELLLEVRDKVVRMEERHEDDGNTLPPQRIAGVWFETTTRLHDCRKLVRWR